MNYKVRSDGEPGFAIVIANSKISGIFLQMAALYCHIRAARLRPYKHPRGVFSGFAGPVRYRIVNTLQCHLQCYGDSADSKIQHVSKRPFYTSSLMSRISSLNCQPSKLTNIRPSSSQLILRPSISRSGTRPSLASSHSIKPRTI